MVKFYEKFSEETFNDIKKCSIEIWETYSDDGGYKTDKIKAVQKIENIADNGIFIIGMFDFYNQVKLAKKLKESSKSEIYEKLISVNNFFESEIFKIK
jgi:hypothetical protein